MLKELVADRRFGEMVLQHRLDSQQTSLASEPYLDPEVDRSVNESLLSSPDRNYIRAILSMDPGNQDLRANVSYLLDVANGDRGRREILKRRSQKIVSLEEKLAPYSTREKILIANQLAALQLSDFCTVGCAWCGIEANRKVGESFSMDSIEKWTREFGKEVKNPAMLYLASDPGDWQDGEYSYINVHPLWTANRGIATYFSTAVPLGSEFSILRFLESTCEAEEWAKKLDPTVMSNGRFLRFSRSVENADRIETMLNILRLRGVSEDFIGRIRIFKLDDQHIRKIGRFINHPNRDEIADNPGISCLDGAVISPKGPMAITMEAYTQLSPKGITEWELTPGKMRIPVYCYRETYYGRPTVVYGKLQHCTVLPDVKILNVENGKIVSTEVVYSIRRDALAFSIVAHNLSSLKSLLLSDDCAIFLTVLGEGKNTLVDRMRSYKKEFYERKRAAEARFNDPDQEAVRIAKAYITRSDEYFEDIEKISQTLKSSRSFRFHVPHFLRRR